MSDYKVMNSKENSNIELDAEVLAANSKYYDGEELETYSSQEIEEPFDLFKTTNREYYDSFLCEIEYNTEDKFCEIMNELLIIAPIHSLNSVDAQAIFYDIGYECGHNAGYESIKGEGSGKEYGYDVRLITAFLCWLLCDNGYEKIVSIQIDLLTDKGIPLSQKVAMTHSIVNIVLRSIKLGIYTTDQWEEYCQICKSIDPTIGVLDLVLKKIESEDLQTPEPNNQIQSQVPPQVEEFQQLGDDASDFERLISPNLNRDERAKLMSRLYVFFAGGEKGQRVSYLIQALIGLEYLNIPKSRKLLYNAIRDHFNCEIGANSGIDKYWSSYSDESSDVLNAIAKFKAQFQIK